MVEARLPKIKNVMSLQTMMYMLGENAPLNLKRKLEVGLCHLHIIQRVAIANSCACYLPVSILHGHCFLQGKALSLTDQFSLPNAQHMISTMATMGFYSKPLLDVCSRKIKGNHKMKLLNLLNHCLI